MLQLAELLNLHSTLIKYKAKILLDISISQVDLHSTLIKYKARSIPIQANPSLMTFTFHSD